MTHAYPGQLAEVTRARWRDLECLDDPGPCTLRVGALPSPAALSRLLSAAYQASLLREEDRPVRFRLFIVDPERLPTDTGPPEGLQALRFTEDRPYNEQEIRRLAMAAPYHRALIGVIPTHDDDFRIWGILQSGPRWLQSARGGRALASPVPGDVIVVRVSGPGLVAVGLGDVTLAELRAGQLEGAPIDAFESEWLAARFVHMRTELNAEHERTMGGQGVPLEPSLTRKISQQMFKRVIAILREAHHGATLLIIPQARAEGLLGEGGTLRLKYAFADAPARRRHVTLVRAIMRELALAAAEMNPPPEHAGFSVYQRSMRPSMATLDEGILEISQLLAALGDVDGAVVLTDRFELLGFGAEITGSLPEIGSVHRALDLEGTAHQVVPIDSVGTRHRSAYRLCALERDALAIVVSHDGAAQFVTWRDGAPTYWEHLPAAGATP
jgi:DisA bacterial checkpoint controller nucleotide-binding